MSTSGEGAPSFPAGGFDALPPPAMARRAEEIGVAKALAEHGAAVRPGRARRRVHRDGRRLRDDDHGGRRPTCRTASRGCSRASTFSLGLILVVVAGAELFTGNNLIVMAWASRRVTTAGCCATGRSSTLGNFVGAIATAVLVYAVEPVRARRRRRRRAGARDRRRPRPAWPSARRSRSARSATRSSASPSGSPTAPARPPTGSSRSSPRSPRSSPSGFEHSVANMYFIPVGLLLKGNEEFVAGLGRRARPLRPDVGRLPARQPPPGDDREHPGRSGHGRRRVLVRLPPRRPLRRPGSRLRARSARP